VAKSLVGESIPAGMLSKTFVVTLNGDTAVEANESFFVTLTAASGATLLDNQAIGTITNDDGPTLAIGNANLVEGDAGTSSLVVTVSLSQVAAVPVTYDIATANSSAMAPTDYVARSLAGETIPAGMLSKTFAVDVNGDTTVEPNEVLLVNLLAATGASIADNQATGLVYNNDGPTLSVGDAVTTEGDAGTQTLTFTVSLSQVAAVPVTYTIGTSNFTATAGSDYVASTLAGQTIPAGQLSKTFEVTVNGDTTVEAHEAFFVTLSAVTGASVLDSQAAGSISNDD
jgi:hypothetical protein